MDKGAHFHRCDLQVHTPRDPSWVGKAYVTDEERLEYAKTLVAACRDRGLQAIAITDHHDMAFVRYVRQAAEEETDSDGKPLDLAERLVVFPGMELTLGVPCQALLLFDADLPEDMFSLAMTALPITANPDSESKVAPIERLKNVESLVDLKARLDEHKFLRDRYIVFPHVGKHGDFSLLRKGMAGKYTEMPCVGGFVDGDSAKNSEGNKNIIAGKAKEWGNKRIACFQTSDNRREDHADLGRATTWVKWATPTAEALRQACLAQESRVSQEEPSLPAIVIGGLSVSNSSFLGPVDLRLNPQYSALIGGRGTGKSTILEYLRWVLCDQPPGAEVENAPNYQARRKRLIDRTLKPLNATAEAWFEVNGVAITVRRDSETGSLLMKIDDDEMRPCSEEEVRRLLPIQAFSQKQLSDVSVRVEELGRFITAPIRSELHSIDEKATDLAGRVRQAHAAVRRRRAMQRALDERELEEKSITGQADALRKSLTGLSEEDQKLLGRGNTFNNADRSVESWREGARGIEEGAQELQQTIESYLNTLEPPPEQPEGAVLSAAHAEYKALLSDAKTAIEALTKKTAALTVAPTDKDESSPWRVWSEKVVAFRLAYEAAVQRSSAHADTMERLKVIEDQASAQAKETVRLREQLRSLGTAEPKYLEDRQAWEKLLDKRADLLEEQCAKLTENSTGAIRAQVRRFADTSDFEAYLRESLTGSRVAGTKIEGLCESIRAAENPRGQWRNVLSELENLAEFDSEPDGAEHRPETPTLSSAGLSPANLDGVCSKLNPDDWLKLSLIPIKSSPIFEYRAREKDYIPFENASAGQQATSLLKTLLNQPGPPLIIDQPEEDLDNPVMLEIVAQVWKAKQQRQLIFASHNANLVVNGDAELVAWCDYRTTGDQSRGMIAGEGAIDVEKVRDAIKMIMEGGEEAFNLRKEKYGF